MGKRSRVPMIPEEEDTTQQEEEDTSHLPPSERKSDQPLSKKVFVY